VDVAVTARLNPTESKEKLLRALENVFPDLEFNLADGLFGGFGEGKEALAILKEHLKLQLIRNSARSFLRARIEDETLSFGINKQAAYMGKISFVDFPIALGTITVEITGKDSDELEKLVEWLCGHAGKKEDTEAGDEGWDGA
jgi:predicted RNA binding protein with dsRBD fold (UPF0201 family)